MEKASNPAEQFLLLGKTVKGAATLEFIRQVLESPGVYAFGEFLNMPNIEELAETPNSAYLDLLKLFAYGKYSDYQTNKDKLPDCSPLMLRKLRHLTIVSLAVQKKSIPYSELLTELEMKNVRELEDLIIDVIYADIITGKLDQKNQILEVEYTIGRDIRKDDIEQLTKVLKEWCEGCEVVLKSIEEDVSKANSAKAYHTAEKVKIENEVASMRKTLKLGQEMEEQMVAESSQERPAKKPSKLKGLRGAGKFFK